MLFSSLKENRQILHLLMDKVIATTLLSTAFRVKGVLSTREFPAPNSRQTDCRKEEISQFTARKRIVHNVKAEFTLVTYTRGLIVEIFFIGSKLSKLVTQPMIKYKDALVDLLEHSKKGYHILSGKRCLSGKQGLLCALLSFRIESGDKDLESHFDTAAKNCTLISPTIQNDIIETIGDIIETIGDIIKDKIVNRIKASKYYFILCDEITDISTKEQITIYIRYVDTSSSIIRKDFIGFVKMVSTTGISIKETLKNELEKVGLHFDDLRACEVSSIKNMNAIIGTVATFFSCSAKRMDKLKHFIDADNSNKSVSTLEHLEKYDANLETSTKASLYVSAITKSDFLVSLEVAVTCLSYTIQLSQVLQKALKAIREDADKSFKEIMKNVTTIASQLEIEICMPRIFERQTARNNVNAKDAEEYYKIVICIPFLDNLILQLHSRFDKRLETIIPLEGLIPSNLSHYDDQAILAAASIYEDDFLVSLNTCLKAELFIWRN
ncbi:hypothetical protein QTP88_012208 [Uroleucon formosanum]